MKCRVFLCPRNGKDLNRNFPDTVDPDSGKHCSGPLDSSGTEQPETTALMRYARSRPFVASASMHEVGSSCAACRHGSGHLWLAELLRRMSLWDISASARRRLSMMAMHYTATVLAEIWSR